MEEDLKTLKSNEQTTTSRASRNMTGFEASYPYECTECHKKFRTKDKLNLHLFTHGDTKSFVCETCKKAFKQPHSLWRHRQLHFSETSYNCDQCHKSFKSKQSLSIHRWIHADKKQFKCNDCEKEFQQPGALYRHRKIHLTEKCFQNCEDSKGKIDEPSPVDDNPLSSFVFDDCRTGF